MKTKNKFITWFVVFILILSLGTYINIKEGNLKIGQNTFNTKQEGENNIINISQVDEKMVDTIITIQGTITELKESNDGHVFLTLKDKTGSILIPIFKNSGINKATLKKNNKYYISGKVDKFNGSLELIPNINGIKEVN
ncbi:MAG: exodeoxyribonuclease VII large subunit [Clostridium sp.]